MLSNDYSQILKDMLISFADQVNKGGEKLYINKAYSLFCPTIGLHYSDNCELLVYGQATNGWANEWTIKNIETDCDKIVKESLEYSTEKTGVCPLEWVNEQWTFYKLYRSFFWNVTYKLVQKYYGKTDDNWTHIIAWSNLMKIAPAKEGNPDDFEYEAQLEHGAKLFRQELLDLKPKNVIVITNLSWIEPILKKLNISFEKADGVYTEAICKFNNSNIIITKRPFVGKHQPFIDEIANLLV
jgi:hypothetical protein